MKIDLLNKALREGFDVSVHELPLKFGSGESGYNKFASMARTYRD